MSVLKVFKENESTPFESFTDHAEIANRLEQAGVIFEKWKAEKQLSAQATQEETLAAYKNSVERLMQERGFLSADVISLTPALEGHQDLRKKFLSEHIHSEDEARFFIDGKGLFYVHIEQMVYAIMCEAGDLINVPEGTRHWFDMGPQPFFKCIRMFTNKTGWEASYTGSAIAEYIPKFDEF